jgi:hypothetical protein
MSGTGIKMHRTSIVSILVLFFCLSPLILPSEAIFVQPASLTTKMPTHETILQKGRDGCNWSDCALYSATTMPASEVAEYWIAGGVWNTQTVQAQSIFGSIRVPSASDWGLDEQYYLLISAWDDNGTYVQLGLGGISGAWDIIYSWTTYDQSYVLHYNTIGISNKLTAGSSYIFEITTLNTYTYYYVYLASNPSNPIWTQNQLTGGHYLWLSNSFPLGPKNYNGYTAQEEAIAMQFDGASPPFSFNIYDQHWTDTNGGHYLSNYWSPFWSKDFPPPAGVGININGDSVFIINPVGDVNYDLHVNILDAILTANAWKSKPGDPNWNVKADINNDHTVNILDEILVAANFGNYYPGQQGGGNSGSAVMAGSTGILLDPSQSTVFENDVFTVNVEVSNVTDLLGWEFQLYWNSTALNCTNATVVTPTIWQGNTQDDGPGLQANYNSTNGMFWWAESANYPAPPFNGSMTIATLTFQALQPGTTSLTLADTILGNSTAQPITCTVSSGSVTVYYGRYMRGDTQTINGLNAYILNIPESTSSASVTTSGLEAAPRWGIRVFVRHSDGTETEAVLDGQTGTPKAVVGGSGLQSANTSMSQTTLQSTDSLVVRVYIWLGADNGWSACATFTTEQLQASTLQAATWTVYYSVHTTFNRLYGYSGTFYWGNTYNSRIQNLQYT